EECSVGGIQVLDEIPAAAVEHARVEAGGIAVVEPDVSVGRAAEGNAAEEVEVVALVESAALLDHEKGIGGLGLSPEYVVVARLEAGRGGAAQVTQRHPGDPEQEEIEDGQEAELERHG